MIGWKDLHEAGAGAAELVEQAVGGGKLPHFNALAAKLWRQHDRQVRTGRASRTPLWRHSPLSLCPLNTARCRQPGLERNDQGFVNAVGIAPTVSARSALTVPDSSSLSATVFLLAATLQPLQPRPRRS